MSIPLKDARGWAQFLVEYKKATTDQAIIDLCNKYKFKSTDVMNRALRRRGLKSLFLSEPLATAVEHVPYPKFDIKDFKIRKVTRDLEDIGIVIADSHVGKITETYSVPIFKQRMEGFLDSVMDIINLHRPIRRAFVFHAGDAMQGENPFQGSKVGEAACSAEDQIHEHAIPAFGRFLVSLAGGVESVNFFGARGNHGRYCLSEDSEILTADGWKGRTEISEEDYAATYNNKLSVVEWQKIQGVVSFPHSGQMISIDTKQVSVLATTEHRFLHKSNAPRHKRILPWGIKTGKQILDDWAQFVLPCAAKSGLPDYPISDSWLCLLGWLITDGSYSNNEINIYQSKPVNLPKIRKALGELGISFSETSRDARGEINICGRATRGNYRQLKFHINNSERDLILALLPIKNRIPKWMWKLSDRQVEVLLDTLIDGDGTRWKEPRRSNCQMVFGKKALLDDIQSLLVTHGLRVISSESRPGQHTLSITKKRPYAVIRKGTSRLSVYNGTVWCIQTPNETIITRRNGRVTITGNSKEANPKTNWDSMFYKSLALSLQNQDRITVNPGGAWYQLVNIKGWKFFLVHGDQVVAQQGIPLFALRRKFQEWFAYFGGFHYAYAGHWHSGAHDHINSIATYDICPPLVTGDDWALEKVGRASKPIQLVFGIHPKYGRTWEYKLYTDPGFLPKIYKPEDGEIYFD